MKIEWNLDLGLKTLDARRQGTEWVARASGGDGAACPGCGSLSRSRKARDRRRLQDLPMQGNSVTLSLELSRWRCRNLRCPRESFVEPLPNVAPSHARRTHRVAELARLIGYSAGARPAEKILRQLGMPQSDDTVLRDLRKSAVIRPVKDPRVVGIDDWAWLKGRRYGTVIVDLEKRIVIDVLSERSADATAKWLSHHPAIEIVSRDHCGLYAQGAARGAPQARQVADRFHLLDNLRLTIEQQLSREQRGVESSRPSRDPITPATMADYQGHGRQAERFCHPSCRRTI